jgi:DnaJ-class molecular chaperone
MNVLRRILKTTCPICKGSGKLPVTQHPKAESHGEETIGECPTCHGKGEVDNPFPRYLPL